MTIKFIIKVKIYMISEKTKNSSFEKDISMLFIISIFRTSSLAVLIISWIIRKFLNKALLFEQWWIAFEFNM